MIELTNPTISFDVAAAAAAMGGNLTENMSKLTSAVSSLPVLLEKKRLIDMHTTIATALLRPGGFAVQPVEVQSSW